MAYDDARRQVVLFGGRLDSGESSRATWTWDGVSWTLQQTSNSPTARFGLNMVYDAARRQVVLFGGLASSVADDTWTWDGFAWTEQHPSKSPPASDGFGMAYDDAREQVVLVTPSGETWTWDGVTWTERHPPKQAPARSNTMAYDAARHEVVLFGGYRGCGEACTDFFGGTWTWDGTTWTKESPGKSPPPEGGFGLAYDATRREVVLFGGFGDAREDFVDFDHTATWAGSTWSNEHPTHPPDPRSDMGFAYDAARQEVVLFGGSGSDNLLGDTWTWDGVTWTEHSRGG